MRPRLTVIMGGAGQADAHNDPDARQSRQRQLARLEGALTAFVGTILRDTAKTGTRSDIIGALLVLESARQELESLLRGREGGLG